MRTGLILAACFLASYTLAQETIVPDLSPEMREALGLDPDIPYTFELLHDDKSKAEGDTSIGRELETAGDFTKTWFCAAARNRYVWRIDFAAPWVQRSDVATILYLDADNDRDTGRKDSEWARGIDVMIRPDGASTFEWPAVLRAASASEGHSLYLAADITLNQEEGQSVFRFWMLTQDTTPGRVRDSDSMPAVTVAAAGVSNRPPVEVPPNHPLYRPPEVVSHVAARMVPDAPTPTMQVTWITSWPCAAWVEYGETTDLGERADAPPMMQNHRVFIPVEAGREYHLRVVCMSSEGEPRAGETLTFAADMTLPAGNVERAQLPLTVTNEQEVALDAAPMLVGVPFAQGALGDVANLRVVQDGQEVPVQVECAARWPDATVKWALVQFLADCPPQASAPVMLEYGSAVRPQAPAPAPMLREEGDLLVCDTGPLRAVMDRRDFGLFRELALDLDGDDAFSPDERIIGPDTGGGLYVVDAEGVEYVSGSPEEVTVEENGPVRAVVNVRGRHVAEDGAELFEYIVRLIFYRGHSHVRILHTFGNDTLPDEMTDVAQLGLRLPLRASEDSACFVGADFGPPEPDTEAGVVGVRGPDAWITARQVDLDRVEVQTSPERAVETDGFAERAQRLREAIVQDPRWLLMCDLVDLPEQYPKGWALRDGVLDVQLCPPLRGDEYADADPVTSDRLYFYLRDGVYRFRTGVTKTHEINLALAPGGEWTPESFPLRGQFTRDLAYCELPAEWYARTAAAGLMTPRVEGEFEEYETFVERSFETFQALRERQAEYGMLNFGDWWGERRYNWGNVEYDTQHVMLMQYLRTLDRRYFKRGCEAALHNRDVDGIHYTTNPRALGQVHVHCMFHTGGYEVLTPEPGLAMPRGGFNVGHVWTRGLLDHWVLTGDRRSRDGALQLADLLAGPRTVGFSVGNHAERDTAWPIFGVMAAYEATADPYYLNAARLMIEDVIRRQDPETGNWGFPAGYSQAEPKPIGGYAWCAGLLITSLDLYNRYAQDPRVDEVNVRTARWLVRDEWIREKQGFRATSCPTFNAGTPPGGAAWSCSAAMLIAHRLTGEEQFLDIGRRAFSLLIRGASGMGKSITQNLCQGPETLWRLRQLGVTSLDATPYLPAGQAAIPRHLVAWPREALTLTVVLPSGRAEPLRAEARVRGTRGVTVEPPFRSAQVAGRDREARLPFEVRLTEDLAPGETRRLMVDWKLGHTEGRQAVTVVRPAPVSAGAKVGLIASGDDFLGPALDALGMQYERLTSLEGISDFGVLMLGTQAHSIDSVGLREGYWKLFPWLRAGGTLLVSQLNDTGWDRFFLPYEVVVYEPDSQSGEIADRVHPIFSRLHPISDASGVWMYDTFSLRPGDPWRVLMRDAEGGPAVVEAPFGAGRLLVMMPSFERLIPAEGTEEGAGWQVFRNIVEYVTG